MWKLNDEDDLAMMGKEIDEGKEIRRESIEGDGPPCLYLGGNRVIASVSEPGPAVTLDTFWPALLLSFKPEYSSGL